MPRLSGLEVLRTLRREQPEVEVVVLTAYGRVDTTTTRPCPVGFFLRRLFAANDHVFNNTNTLSHPFHHTASTHPEPTHQTLYHPQLLPST